MDRASIVARVVSFVRTYRLVATIMAIPAVIALTNATWLTDRIGDVDVWFYNGYFKALRAIAENRDAWGPAKYFETRLPIIVPGALVYGVFPDAVARVVLNLCILHGAIALSFWYVVRTHVSRPAATAATVLLVTDIFYLRTIGWDYTDNAVLAYQALTFALLTRGRSPTRAPISIAGAGFAATSMLMTNPGSLVMLPLFAIYSLCVVDPVASLREVPARLARLAAWSSAGAAE